ncbi:MAG: cysteine hydrolase family protein [Faecalibacterium sp.]
MEKEKIDVLIVVDMQNDFVTGSLGTPEAQAIVPKVVEKIKNWKGEVLYTRDTHHKNYLETQEGKHLPVKHCLFGTSGWQLVDEVDETISDEQWCEDNPIYDKHTFGSARLADDLVFFNNRESCGINSITLVGLCTDICVISNALLLKAALPEVPIIVDANCCAGVTPESHKNALAAMKMCQIEIVNEE